MARPASDQARNRLIAAVHAAKKSAGLDDDAYRDTLEAATGRRSSADCTDAELRRALDRLNGLAGRPAAPRRGGGGPQAGKVTALWWSLYHLDVVEHPTDEALAAFVKRMTGVDALRWASPDQIAAIIDGLKAMAARDGGVDWSPAARGKPRDPRLAVAEAQWKRLRERGAALPAATLHAYALWSPGKPLTALVQADWTRLHQELGRLVRAARPAEGGAA